MDKKNLLVFGYGYSSRHFVSAYPNQFDRVAGTTRTPSKLQTLREQSIDGLLFSDASKDDALLHEKIHSATHILISIAPSVAGDLVLNRFSKQIANAPDLCALVYFSTVGVYGHHDCKWVDENSECRPVSERSKDRMGAENQWQALADSNNIPLAILRLSGIYGPGRNAFITMEKGKSRRLVKKNQVFNRIHVADIAQATAMAFEKRARGIFNITDDEPAPPQDVVTFAHELAGRTPPPEQDFETAELTPMARSFYGECKKVSNAKSKSELGMTYQWPNYRQALGKMWREPSQRYA